MNLLIVVTVLQHKKNSAEVKLKSYEEISIYSPAVVLKVLVSSSLIILVVFSLLLLLFGLFSVALTYGTVSYVHWLLRRCWFTM